MRFALRALVLAGSFAAAACVSTPPITMPQYQVDRERLADGLPAPATENAPGISASAMKIDPVKIQPATATGYNNLPTTVTQIFDGPARKLALSDVVVETLANDRTIKVQGYTLRIAEFQVPVSKGIYDLVAGLSASYSHIDQPNVPAISPISTNASTYSFGPTLSQLLPWGGMIGLAYQAAHSATLVEPITGVLPGSPFNAISYPQSTTLSISQPLLRGFGTNITNASIHIAQIERQGAAADFQVTVETRLANALSTYWNLIGAIEDYKVEVIAFSAAQDLLRVNRAKFREGVLASTDVLQAEAAMEERRNLIIQARQNIRDLEDLLKRQLFLRDGTPDWQQEIEPTQAVAYRPMEIDLEQTIQVALAQRAELRRSDSNIREADVNLRVADNNRLPSLSAFGTIDANGNGSDFSSSLSDEDRGKHVGYTAGIQFSYPLQNRAARYQYRQAEARRDQAKEQKNDAVDQVTLEVREAVRALRSARDQIETTQSGVRSEEAKLQAEMKRYDVGLSTLYQIILFQNDLATAQSSHIAAVVNYNLAAIRLERARGDLLTSFGIQVMGANLTPGDPPIGFPIKPE